MLAVDKNLNPKNIRGKRYRLPFFSMSAIISIPIFAMAIIMSANLPPREGRGAIIGLILCVWMALPVALLLGFRKTSYIMGADRLYFFNSLVIRPANEKRKKMYYVRTNGSVSYSDITDFRFIEIEFEGHPRKGYIVPPRVVIIGDDFEVEIYAYRNLIKRIKEINQKNL